MIDIKRHHCPFNDGECDCKCYIAGIKAVKKELKKWFKNSEEPIENFIKNL